MYSKKETKKNIKCTSCKDSIPNSIVNIRSHVHKHVNSPLYSCKVCQVAYKEQYQVYEHIKEKHDGKLVDSTEAPEDTEDLQKVNHQKPVEPLKLQ
uniref:C2H2-type domain-containing protein n=1 Tax=Acrobeloides nanus TaxID=290746 RepID=A0A914EAX2_9BILA